MADLFVSYAREDREGAAALVAALSEAGWSVFYDEHLPAGSDWIKELERELRAARCLVILLSAAARDSTWIQEEKLFAESIGLSVFPVRLDSSPLPFGFGTRHAASLPNWKGDANDAAFRAFVEKLERQCLPSSRPAAQPPPIVKKPPAPRITRSVVRLFRFFFSSPVQRAYRRAEALRAEGRWEEAFEAYTNVLTRAPDHANAFAGRSLVATRCNRPFEEDHDRAFELGTTRHEMHEILAAAAADGSGDYARAIELYARAKRACKPRWWQPPEPGWRAAYRHYCSQKANCHMALRQDKEALDELSEAILYSWEDGELHRRRSFVYELLGNRAAAARDDERATKLGWPKLSIRRPRSRYG